MWEKLVGTDNPSHGREMLGDSVWHNLLSLDLYIEPLLYFFHFGGLSQTLCYLKGTDGADVYGI